MFFSRNKNSIEADLDAALIMEKKSQAAYDSLSDKLEDLKLEHNTKLKYLNKFKENLKEKQMGIMELSEMIERYKVEKYREKCQRNQVLLENEYNSILSQVNSLEFSGKPSTIKEYKRALDIKEKCGYRILKERIEEYINTNRDKLVRELIRSLDINSTSTNTVYILSFLVELENLFNTQFFINHLFESLSVKFHYHFLSERESSRFDKPEWMFSFIEKEIVGIVEILEIYDEVNDSESDINNGNNFSSGLYLLLVRVNELILKKLNSLSLLNSDQQRQLISHFYKKAMDYYTNIEREYSITLPTRAVTAALWASEMTHIHDTLEEIHGMNYLQWGREYKKLIRDTYSFIGEHANTNNNTNMIDRRGGIIDNSADSSVICDIGDVCAVICLYNKEFLSNLNYNSREEIRVICYIFTETESIKQFITDEELDYVMTYGGEGEGVSGNSIKSLTDLLMEMWDLINTLVLADVEKSISSIKSFMYATDLDKRTFLITTSKRLEDYEICVKYGDVTEIFVDRIDSFILDRIILEYRFTSEEYLDFIGWYNQVKGIFSGKEISRKFKWLSDEAMEALKCIFEKRKSDSQFYKILLSIYTD